MNLSMKQKQTHRHKNRLVVAKEEVVGEGWTGELGISICKLLHIEWINSKGPTLSTKGTRFNIL